MSYARDLQPKDCTEPIRGKNMVKGLGGGFGFQVGDLDRLRRFLILGHQGGTYYADQRKLSIETVDCIDRLCKTNAGCQAAVQEIVTISKSGRAPKNDPAIFALAYMVSKGGIPSIHALPAVKEVCRIGTHLFDFLNNCKALGRGWGSGFKRTIAEWYTDRDPKALAMQVTKYAQRNGWSHRDVLRKAHPIATNDQTNEVLQYVAQKAKWEAAEYIDSPSANLLMAVEVAKNLGSDTSALSNVIRANGLVREHVPTEALNSIEVWDALLEKMPLTAMIRNLGKMTSIGLVKPLSAASQKIVEALEDRDALKAQRVHPVTILLALKTYQQGRGVLGSLSWQPDQNVLEALENAFYAAFDVVEPTDKKFVLGVDVSGSMSCPCIGSPIISCREAALVMAMTAKRTEKWSHILGFSHDLIELPITNTTSLVDACRIVRGLPFRSTRCAAPIEWALNNKIEVDVFCIYTDNETNCGPHPSYALGQYRQKMGRNAKLAVFGLANSHFTIADPDDIGMMDFVGFDAAAPALLADFAR